MNILLTQEAIKKPEMSIIRFFPKPAFPKMAVLLEEGTS